MTYNTSDWPSAPLLDRIYNCDALELLESMPGESVNCIVTSPPYWGLRDYGTATWEGGLSTCKHSTSRKDTDNKNSDTQGLSRPGLDHSHCKLCGAKRVDKQIGLEPTLKEFIETLVILFREVRRVLRSDGTCWINMGDSYASSVNGRSAADTKATGNDDRTFRDKPFSTVGNGLKPKDLCGQPWRLALALQDDGWWLRQDIIWAKPNPMPESVSDRCTKSHEYIFLMTKSEHYWFDAESIREPAVNGDPNPPRGSKGVKGQQNKGNRKTFRGGGTYTNQGAFNNSDCKSNTVKGNTQEPVIDRNKRSVWTVSTAQTKDAHFATFPIELITPMILAGCPAMVCDCCGKPYEREVETVGGTTGKSWVNHDRDSVYGLTRHGSTQPMKDGTYTRVDKGFKPTCSCGTGTTSGVVYDPFMGSGTTALVARSLGRRYIGSELNAEYIKIASDRLRMPMEKRQVVKESNLEGLPLFENIA